MIYSTWDLNKAFGLDVQLIKYWVRTGRIIPSVRKTNGLAGRGSSSLFSQEDAEYLCDYSALIKKGCSHPLADKLIKQNRKEAIEGILNT